MKSLSGRPFRISDEGEMVQLLQGVFGRHGFLDGRLRPHIFYNTLGNEDEI